MEDVKAKVAKLVSESIGLEFPVSPSQRFSEDLKMDSLDFIDLLVNVDKTFGIRIPASDIPAIATVRGLADYIEARQ